jgi:hypothetical protein
MAVRAPTGNETQARAEARAPAQRLFDQVAFG